MIDILPCHVWAQGDARPNANRRAMRVTRRCAVRDVEVGNLVDYVLCTPVRCHLDVEFIDNGCEAVVLRSGRTTENMTPFFVQEVSRGCFETPWS